jgi:predicted nucleic acid-binding protein
MRIIVDTNLVFSAILNTKGTIGDLFLNSGDTFAFYSCHYLWTEIDDHRDKLKKISKMTDKELSEIEHLIENGKPPSLKVVMFELKMANHLL